MTNLWSSIHYLRGIAAILVVIHHIPQYLETRGNDYPFSFEIGAIGVDIFFAISGFVMYHTASKQGLRPQGFILDRLKRVIPLYWTITVALGATTLLLPSLFSSFKPTGDQIVKSMLFIPIYSDSGMIRPVLAMGWTLHYEMLFYVTTGICLFLKDKINGALLSTSLLATLSIVFFSLPLDYKYTALQTLAPLVIEFLFGALIAHTTKSIKKQAPLIPEALLFIASGSLLILSNTTAYESIHFDRLMSWGTGAALITLGLVLLERPIQNLSRFSEIAHRFLYMLGNTSYSLYLTHGISFSISYQVCKLVKPGDWAFHSAILLINAIVIGFIAHKIIEKPLTKALKGFKL